MKENDKVKIVKKGKYFSKKGIIKIKTSNGWYHIEINGEKDLQKFRLIDITKGDKITKGQHDGKRMDEEYQRKIKKRQQDVQMLVNVLNKRKPKRKDINKALIKVRISTKDLTAREIAKLINKTKYSLFVIDENKIY